MPICAHPALPAQSSDRHAQRRMDPIEPLDAEQHQPAAHSLDFTSPSFDALQALHTPGLRPPVPDAAPLDNVAKCRAILPPELPESLAQQQAVAPKSQAAAEKAAALKARAERAVARAEAGVHVPSLDAIAAAATSKYPGGPLAPLRVWLAERARVLVVTRHAAGVRGRAVGTLAGYDRFLNLLLRDVEESYTVVVRVERRAKQQAEGDSGGGGGGSDAGASSSSGRGGGGDGGGGAGAPRPRVRWCRKQERRWRRLDQALLKGSSVVLVARCADGGGGGGGGDDRGGVGGGGGAAATATAASS